MNQDIKIRYASKYCQYLRNKIKHLERTKYIQLAIVVALIVLIGILGYQLHSAHQEVLQLRIDHAIGIQSLADAEVEKREMEARHEEEMYDLLKEFSSGEER